MLVKDIINLCCEFLDNSALAQKFVNGEELSEEDNLEIAEITKCINLVRQEICSEIMPIVKIEKVKTENLKLDFSVLENYPISIIDVKDSMGRRVKYRVMNGFLIAFANEIEVWYSVKPEQLSQDGNFVSTLPERVYAYGAVREYYIKKALYKDAQVWEERFKNSLEMLEKRKSSVTIPRRRWL